MKKMEERRRQCIKQLCSLEGWALGALVETEREQGGQRKPFRYLSRSVRGKNRITYVSEVQMEPLKKALASGAKAKELLEAIADLTVALIKAETKGK